MAVLTMVAVHGFKHEWNPKLDLDNLKVQIKL
jgi:hypothetical protein